MSVIGRNIRKIRKFKGLTQKQLSERSGIIETTIRKYELDITVPKTDNLKKIANALDIPITSLTGEETENATILGNIIKEQNKKHSLNAEIISEQIGFKKSVIDSWQNGISEPDVVSFLQLCYYSYGITEAYSLAEKTGLLDSALWDFSQFKADNPTIEINYKYCPYCGKELPKDKTNE